MTGYENLVAIKKRDRWGRRGWPRKKMLAHNQIYGLVYKRDPKKHKINV